MSLPPFFPYYDLHLLEQAWSKVASNSGCAGGDNETIPEFARRARIALPALSERLAKGTYQPRDMRHLSIQKANGGTRPLAIPSVIDRVAMTSVAQALTPHLDKTFSDGSYGYRRNRSVQMAVDRVSALRRSGFEWVVEADIVRCFERIPHDGLMEQLETVLGSRNRALLDLIGLWLAHGAAEAPGIGLAQGSPLSPLLANLYLDQLDVAFEGQSSRLIRFADDFVILTRSKEGAVRALARAEDRLAELGLELKSSKTGVRGFDDDLSFLGHVFVRSLTLPAPRDREEDTILLLQTIASKDEMEARAAIEAAEDTPQGARVLYMQTPKLALTKAGHSFRVEDETGRLKMEVLHRRVARIEMGPQTTMDTQAMRLAIRTGTPVDFVTGYGETLGTLAPPAKETALLHLAQARALDDPKRCADIAREIVLGRLANMRSRLHVLNRKDKRSDVTLAIRDLGYAMRKAKAAGSVEELRGHEGQGAAVYWPALGALCDGAPVPFRRSRPARDPLNAAINYLTALLSRDIGVAIDRAGLHRGFGFLHRPSNRGDALVYDLMEGFRAGLTEGLAVGLFNKRRLRPEMFVFDASVRISAEGRRAIIAGYEESLRRKVRSPHSGRKHVGRERMTWEAYALASALKDGERTFLPARQDH